VRQFFFTEDELRDVATYLVGKDQIVPAFGFAFYKPKELRIPPVQAVYRELSIGSYINPGWHTTTGSYVTGNDTKFVYATNACLDGIAVADQGAPVACAASPAEIYTASTLKKSQSVSVKSAYVRNMAQTQPVKDVSIGAGAKINQTLEKDPYPLDSWCDKPEAVMTIYFVFHEQFEQIKAGGMKDFSGKPEGMLEGIPVG